MIINNLFSIPQNAIWAFVNEDDRRVYIGYSERAVGAIGQAITDIQRHCHKWIPGDDIGKLKLVLLEEFNNRLIAQLRVGVYVDKYRKEGYTLYRKYNHEKRFLLEEDFVDNKYYGLMLRSKCGDEIVLGVFNTKNECIEYRKTYCRNIADVVICNNKLTREYYEQKDT